MGSIKLPSLVNHIASNIRSLRLARNYSQDYLAFKLNISQNAYSKLELGQTNITVERLSIIAEVLGVELFQLIEVSDIKADVEAVKRIQIVPKLLEVVCRTTGMGFAAIARVTEDKWVACGVRDEISFGLEPGSELKLETTICNEIRQSGEAVIIDHVDKDEVFSHHHTPAMYGFQSYISMPIIRQDGTFFGTLCAIDPKPHKLNNTAIIGLFKLFAELISFHLNPIGFYRDESFDKIKKNELKEQFMAVPNHELHHAIKAGLN
jgi:transcriptional regulator with XRE-family HTH domain